MEDNHCCVWVNSSFLQQIIYQNALPKNFCVPAFNTVNSYSLLVILVIIYDFVVGALNCFVHKPRDGQQVSCLVYVLRSLNRVFINTADRREFLALILSDLCRVISGRSLRLIQQPTQQAQWQLLCTWRKLLSYEFLVSPFFPTREGKFQHPAVSKNTLV